MFDRNGDGKLSMLEFRWMTDRKTLTNHNIKMMWSKCDLNKDGYLDFEEFREMILRARARKEMKNIEEDGEVPEKVEDEKAEEADEEEDMDQSSSTETEEEGAIEEEDEEANLPEVKNEEAEEEDDIEEVIEEQSDKETESNENISEDIECVTDGSESDQADGDDET